MLVITTCTLLVISMPMIRTSATTTNHRLATDAVSDDIAGQRRVDEIQTGGGGRNAARHHEDQGRDQKRPAGKKTQKFSEHGRGPLIGGTGADLPAC